MLRRCASGRRIGPSPPIEARAPLRSLVQIVDPADELRHLDRRDVEIHDEALLPATGEYTVQLELIARVDLLVRYIRRYVDEVPGSASATYSSRSPQRIRASPLTT